jgi:hypothetical protein
VHSKTRARAASATLTLIVGCQLPAAAQSLALTYELDGTKHVAHSTALAPYPCAGADWLIVIRCGRPGAWSALADAAENEIPADDRRASAGGAIVSVPTAVPREPFQGESLTTDARLRPPVGGRAADVSLRAGASARLPSFQDTREPSPFTARAYEGSLQSNAYKALGLELLVPFR